MYYDEERERKFRTIWDCVLDIARLGVIVTMAVCVLRIAAKVTGIE